MKTHIASLLLALSFPLLAETPLEIRANAETRGWTCLAVKVLRVRADGLLVAQGEPVRLAFIAGHPKLATLAEGDFDVFYAEPIENFRSSGTVLPSWQWRAARPSHVKADPTPAPKPAIGATGIANRTAHKDRKR